MPAVPQVLVVDDDAAAANALCRYLAGFGFAAHAVGDDAAMRACLATRRIDLMVLSLQGQGEAGGLLSQGLSAAPGPDGRRGARLPIIAVRDHLQLIDRVIGLEMGADDVLAKPVEPRELVARIRAVLRRSAAPAWAPVPAGSGLVRFDGWALDDHERRLTAPNGRRQSLSDAEFRLLSTLLQSPRRVCSRAHLALQARGQTLGTCGRSIDLLVSRLRLKLADPGGASGLIKTVRGAGYLLDVRSVQGLGPGSGWAAPALPDRFRTGLPAAG
jgi:two-component system OmpR family response regulator